MKRKKVVFAALASVLCSISIAQAAINVAGELIVDLRNEDLSAATNVWINHATGTNSVGDFVTSDGNLLNMVPAKGDAYTNYANAVQINFNASKSVISSTVIPDSLTGNNTRSVEAWIFANSLGGSSTPVGWGDSGTGNLSSFRYTSNSGNGLFSGWNADVPWTTLPPVGKWTYVVWTYDGSTVMGYVDGTLNSSASLAATSGWPLTTITNVLCVGAGRGGTTDGFDGYIADVRVHTGVLGPDDVLNNYAEGIVTPDLSPYVTGLADASVFAGQSLTLTPTATGGLPLYYQWSANSVVLAGETNATLSLTNIQLSASGTVYEIAVSNSYGIATDSMTLTVEDVPDIGPVSIFLDVSRGSAEYYTGKAIASGAGTVWNAFVPPAGPTKTLDAVVDSQGNALDPVSITITRNNGEVIKAYNDANTTDPAKGNPNPLNLMSDYLYQGPYTIEIGGLSEGDYDLYVYPKGNASSQFSTITVAVTNGGAVGVTSELGEFRNIYQTNFPALNNTYCVVTGAVHGTPAFTFQTSGYLNGFQLVSATPVIQGLTNQSVLVGTNVVIDAGVAGRAPFTFQWSLNGSVLPGETNATIVINDVQAGQSGEYSLLVSNSIGSDSGSMTLEVGGGGPITIDSISIAGGTANITWTSDAGPGYAIESSPSLTAPAWSEVTNLTSAGSQTTAVPVSGDDQEFYRVSK